MPSTEIEKIKTLLQINNAIIHQRSREGLFREITALLQPLFHFDRISIVLNRPGRLAWDYFSPAIGVLIPGTHQNTMPPEKSLVLVRAMTERRTIVADLVHGPVLPESDMILKAGLKWFICVPLLMRDSVLGTVQIFYRNAASPDAERMALLEQVAQQIALAVDNMLAYEELERLRDSLVEEKSYLSREIETLKETQDILYACPAMEQVMKTVRNVAATDTTVLLTGETGTGKDLLARFIHRNSPRSSQTYIKVNCAALVPTLIESELFGHEKGAFTGAAARKIGRFEIAHKSTLFLDEIGELPLTTQAKLLQVLQEREFERVGGTETIRTDVRIIAATNQNLRAMVVEKNFREDLFYRLNIFPVLVPPLRERREDIPLLGKFFADRFCAKLHRPRPSFDKSAVDVLLRYNWPGNVRELQNFIERVIILKSNQTLTGDDITPILNSSAAQDDGAATLEDAERRHIEKALASCSGVLAGPRGAAEQLGVKRATLQYRMKKLGIQADMYRKA
ncbi:MAG: sigma 54-interacting transcriptional regulator [Deltaproteobacteria bacterium]|nr:sigma 54-interacting transcriptional regulator [Deltaproteobacteria bacterium]